MNKKNRNANTYVILTEKDQETIELIAEKHREAINFAIEILEHLSSDFAAKNVTGTTKISVGAQCVILSLYTQAFRVLRSIIDLCRSGQAHEAEILLRTLIDVETYILYLTEKDQDERGEYFLHSTNLSHIDAIDKGEEVWTDVEAGLNKDAYESAKNNALEYFKEKYGTTTIKEIKARRCTLTPHKAAEQLEEHREVIKNCRLIAFKAASMVAHGEATMKFGRLIVEKDANYDFAANYTLSEDLVGACLRLSVVLSVMLIKRIHEVLGVGKKEAVDFLITKAKDIFGPSTELVGE